MHSISFGAEGDNSVGVVSVKILLKQAYSAHLTKVKSLETQLKELKEQLLQTGKSDKSKCNQCKEAQKTLDLCKQEYAAVLDEQRKRYECLAQKVVLLENRNVSDKSKCNQCKEAQKTLDLCKQEYAAVLDEQRKRYECLAQKVVLLENRNVRVCGNSTSKKDVPDRHDELCLESPPKKQVLTSISTNVGFSGQNPVDSEPDHSKEVEANHERSHSAKDNTGVLCSSLSFKDKNRITPVSQKGFFSSLQSSFLDYSSDCDIVLVTETLDVLDEVPKKDNNQKKTSEKENNAPKGKSAQTLCDVDEGKENVSNSMKSPSSRKRHSTTSSNESRQTQKKHKTVGSKEILIENGTSCGEKVLHEADPPCAKLKEDSIYSQKDDPGSTNKAQDMSSFSVGSTFFDVNPSFLEQKSESVLSNSKKSKTQSPKKSKTRNPAIEITHDDDDDDDFQTSVNSVSKKGNDSGAWKTSKKNLKKTSNSVAIKTTSRFKLTLEAPSLNFRKPKFKQTKLSKSIFQPSHTHTTDSISLSENYHVAQKNGSDTKSDVKESNGNSRVKESNDNSRVKESNDNRRVEDNSGNSVKEDNGNKVRDHGNSRETQKELHDDDNVTLTWERGTFSNSEMEILDGGSFSSSEMENLKKMMTADMDATFVPYHMLQNFKDSVPDVAGMSNMTEGLTEQREEPVNTCDQDVNRSSDFVADVCRQKALHEESRANKNTAYNIKQFPEKDLLNPPPSKIEKEKCNSFDRVPPPEVPNYKFKEDPVRGKDKRQQLKGFDCKECEKYYSALGLSDKERKERLKQCSRHRATHVPPATPANFWEIDFPDTQECKERGYVGDTQKVALKSRRRRPLK